MVAPLLIDVGNTRIKWRRGGGDMVACSSPEAVFEGVGDKISHCAIAATGHRACVEALQSGLARRFESVAFFLPVSEAVFGDLKNSYAVPATMGVDRWLAMIAAYRMTKQACVVVDAGSALTVDVIAADGRHEGGWIVPGMGMMRSMVAKGTARVGIQLDETMEVFGQSTGEAVFTGTREALTATAVHGVQRAMQRHESFEVLVTGGDAPLITAALEGCGAPVHCRPELVLDGLQLRWEASAC